MHGGRLSARWFLAIALAGAMVAIGWLMWQRNSLQEGASSLQKTEQTASSKAAETTSSVVSPGVSAASSAVASTQSSPAAYSSSVPMEPAIQSLSYGSAPSVHADANAATKSVMEALKNKDHPERLSPLIQPKPFDPAAFARDPQAYCNTIEPGRVFQSAQPSADTPHLILAVPSLQTIEQGASVPLRVGNVPPGLPVTFAAFDGGRFQETKLNVCTVVADETGVATARYEATAGVISEVKILAASPVASGQVSFTVYVNRNDKQGTQQ